MSEPKTENVIIEVTGKEDNKKDSSNIEFVPEDINDSMKVDELTEEESNKIDEMFKEEELQQDQSSDLAGEAKDLLNKFKNYISGDKLDEKCEEAEKRTGVKKDIIKNAFVKNSLRTIADALNLTISIAGDIIIGAVNFVENIIRNIVNFTTGTLHKVITAVTLNCGTAEY